MPVFSLMISIGYIGAVFQLPTHARHANYPKDSRLIIATYNVKGFQYGQTALTVNLIADFLAENKVDILCLQEFDVTPEFPEDKIKNVLDFLPYQSIVQGEKTGFALAIFSKYPISKSYKIKFRAENNQAMWSDIVFQNDTIRIFNFHLQTTNFNQEKFDIVPEYWLWDLSGEASKTMFLMEKLKYNSDIRISQGQVINSLISTTKNPVLACGDMNDNPASFTYHLVKGDLKDGFKTSGCGYEYTYKHLFNLFRTDYIFHSKDLSGIKYKSYNLNYSDHKPVIMELSIPMK